MSDNRRRMSTEGRRLSTDSQVSHASGPISDYDRLQRNARLSMCTSQQPPLQNMPNQGYQHDFLITNWIENTGGAGTSSVPPRLGHNLRRTTNLRLPATSGRPATPPSAPTPNYSHPMNRNIKQEQKFSLHSQRNSISEQTAPDASIQLGRHNMAPVIAAPATPLNVPRPRDTGMTWLERARSQQRGDQIHNAPSHGFGQPVRHHTASVINPPTRGSARTNTAPAVSVTAQEEAYLLWQQQQEQGAANSGAGRRKAKMRHIFTGIFRRHDGGEAPAGSS